MRLLQRLRRPSVVVLAGACAIAGCGGGSGGMVPIQPISVSLGASRITVPAGGKPVYLQITIASTSETALVNFTGLPAGVKVTYAASDTNPSGLLTFTATAAAPAGTFVPTVTVNSAGQTVSLQFTLIVLA